MNHVLWQLGLPLTRPLLISLLFNVLITLSRNQKTQSAITQIDNRVYA